MSKQSSQALSAPAPANEPKRWTVGTLTYTTGGLLALFCWLLWGDFGYYLKERSVQPTLLLLLKQYKVSDFLIGLLITSLPQAITIVLAPIISYRSDRHRGKWGRRIPFLLVPTPIAFVSMVGLAFSPVIGRWLHVLLGVASPGETMSIIMAFTLFWSVFEFCTITCNSAFIGLINDVVPRPVISRFFAMFRFFSLGAGMLFQYFLFGKAEVHYVPIFLGIGALYAISFTAMCLMVKEGEYPPPPPPTDPTAGGIGSFFSATKTYFRDCFSKPYYLWIFFSIALVFVAVTPITLFSIYFAKSVNMSMDRLGELAALQLLISLLQSYPMGWLSDKFHPLRVTLAMLALYVIATLAAFLFVHDATSYSFAYVITGTIYGAWFTASMPIGAMLFPKSKFATFDSARIICFSLGMMITGPLAGWAMDRVLHQQYRYIYFFACCFTALSFFATLVVYRRFMAYGGPKGYVAPE
ncbi:MAG: MFS transporter [Opitutae bacterium]|nr:MFS transporter [Opitutae bacterium]